MWLLTLVVGAEVAILIDRSTFAYLGADPRLAPWTLLTYPFANALSPLNLAFVGIWLWWVGSSLESFWGSRKLLIAWVGLGIAHDLLAMLVSGHSLVGLMVLTGTLTVAWTIVNPGARILLMFILPVTAVFLRYLTLLGIFLAAGQGGNAASGLAAVVLALVAGYWTVVAPGKLLLPAKYYKKRTSRSKARLKVVPSASASVSFLPTPPTPPTPLEQDIDRILDKIRLEGMSALTSEERNLLDEHSSRLRRGG